MTMTDDEFMERSRKALAPHLDMLNLRDGSNGDGLSIQTWEEACAESQAWANAARKRVAIVRRDRHRAYLVIALMVIILIIAFVIVEQT